MFLAVSEEEGTMSEVPFAPHAVGVVLADLITSTDYTMTEVLEILEPAKFGRNPDSVKVFIGLACQLRKTLTERELAEILLSIDLKNLWENGKVDDETFDKFITANKLVYKFQDCK